MLARVRRLLAVVLLAGCATGQGGPAVSAPEERLAQVRAECVASVTPADGAGALRWAVEQGGPATLFLMIRGAADGALWGAVKGGAAADGAWIGAAVGAGLGVIVGVVAGVGKSLDDQRRHRMMYETCVASRLGADEITP